MKPWVRLLASSVGATCCLLAATNAAAEFSYNAPGILTSGSGSGRKDTKVYVPGMRFPIETGPAFANSQVWGRGGGSGPGGGQCDKPNYSFPWQDNYCESRSWDMPLCPSGTGHQGQDIRPATCEKLKYFGVATTDGTITNVGSYSVYLTAADGTRFDYLHMGGVLVKVGQKVKRGDRLGKVSNEFGGTPTTIHLHFNLRQTISGVGTVYVPPYMSLIQAYESLMGVVPPADAGPVDGGVKDTGTFVDVGADTEKADSSKPDVADSGATDSFSDDTFAVEDGDPPKDDAEIVIEDTLADTAPDPSDATDDAADAEEFTYRTTAGCSCRVTQSTETHTGLWAFGVVVAAFGWRRRSRRA